jgi:hypothetical protein
MTKLKTRNLYISSRGAIFIYKVSLFDTIQEIIDFSKATNSGTRLICVEILYLFFNYLNNIKWQDWKLRISRSHQKL